MQLSRDQARSKVLGQDIPPSQRVILISLIDWSDGLHHAHVSQASLAKSLGMTVVTVGRSLESLEKDGYLYRDEEGQYMIPWPFIDEVEVIGGPKRERRLLMERPQVKYSLALHEKRYEELGQLAVWAMNKKDENMQLQYMAEADQVAEIIDHYKWFLKYTKDEEPAK